MKYIERSLSILRGDISSNSDSYNHALEEIINRRDELKPLFNECCEKGISMQDLCPELNDEWNEIILLIAKSNCK